MSDELPPTPPGGGPLRIARPSAPPPRSSPSVPSAMDADTGPIHVDHDYLRAERERWLQEDARRAADEAFAKRVRWVVTAVAGIVVGTFGVINVARAQAVDAGVPTVKRVETLEADFANHKREELGRAERFERALERIEVRQQADLAARRIPDPAPIPKDGGR